MPTEQELADMEKMSNDFVPETQVLRLAVSRQLNESDIAFRGPLLGNNNLPKH